MFMATEVPLPVPAVARIVLLTIALLPGCGPPQHGGRSDAATLRRELDATAQYEVLLKRLLTDQDPVTVQTALLCESRHVLHLLGPARLTPALEAAEQRAYQPSDRPRQQAVNKLVANRAYEASDSLCLRLGRAGYLTDTTWIAGAGP